MILYQRFPAAEECPEFGDGFEAQGRQKDGFAYKAIVGASDVGITVDGPERKDHDDRSVRRSYLQFLFAALELPFLPIYNDFQAKVKYTIDDRHQITFLGWALSMTLNSIWTPTKPKNSGTF